MSRLDKPIGTLLLLHPCLWSLSLLSPTGLPPLATAASFTVGALAMRGAGCTVNDMWDVEFDKNVARTKSRPLASGELSMPQATAHLGLQLSLGLAALLSLPHTEDCFYVACASLPLVVLYPTAKRWT
ncbi:hypothetical protein TeGR_g8608, partial [Tetraparma gracilis]